MENVESVFEDFYIRNIEKDSMRKLRRMKRRTGKGVSSLIRFAILEFLEKHYNPKLEEEALPSVECENCGKENDIS